MKRAFGPRAALLVLAACACSSNPAPAAPAVPPPVNPVGYFEFATEVEGQMVTGSIEIQSVQGGGYTGVLSTTATEPVPVSTVTVEAQKLTASFATPDGAAVLVLNFTGDAFTGTWTYAGMSGVLTGKRVR
jgi:hypothetical protein